MDNKAVIKEIIEWLICFIVAVAIALLVRYYIGTPTIVKNVSMNPTLEENQRLWLNRWSRTTSAELKRGDIVTFEAPAESQLKLAPEEVDLENPIAKYEYEPEGVWERFTYYVLEKGKTSYIKRIIGLPGEHVKIEDGFVYINGEKLEEDYLPEGLVTDMNYGFFNDFTIPEGTYFLLGDNRGQSADSRRFGCIPYERIESKVAFRFWPLNLFGEVK